MAFFVVVVLVVGRQIWAQILAFPLTNGVTLE